jgi:hypothetical protein
VSEPFLCHQVSAARVWRCRGKVFDALEAKLAAVRSAAVPVVTEPSVQIVHAPAVPRVSTAFANLKQAFGSSTNAHMLDICKSISQFEDTSQKLVPTAWLVSSPHVKGMVRLSLESRPWTK